MTHYTRADLDMADRHIAEGEAHILRQEKIVTRLHSNGAPTGEAENLLRLLNETQAEHRRHRRAIVEALEGTGR